MKSLDFGRYALNTCVAVVMLSGCGGSQQQVGTPGAVTQPSAMAAIPKELTGLRAQFHGHLARCLPGAGSMSRSPTSHARISLVFGCQVEGRFATRAPAAMSAT